MIQRVLVNYPFTGLTCVGLVIFMCVFVAALFWVFRKESKEVYAKLESMPLHDLQPKP